MTEELPDYIANPRLPEPWSEESDLAGLLRFLHQKEQARRKQKKSTEKTEN